jgi:hypothetical protein
MMRIKLFILTILVVVFGINVKAQPLLMSGKIIEAEMGEGLSGVTLQIKSSGKTFTTDTNGYFKIQTESIQPTDSVLISCMGFFPIGRVAAELKNATLMLSPRSYVLKEVSTSRRKPQKKQVNAFRIKDYGERDRIPDLGERQTDMIGRYFAGDLSGKYHWVSSVQVLQEGVKTKDISTWRGEQHWRFRLRVVEATADGLPTDSDLLKQRAILTVSDADYQYYDEGRYDERTNSTSYTNRDYGERSLYGVIKIDLRKYEVPYSKNGIFVFLELLPPLISGGDRIFKLALFNVGNTGWYRNGRSKQWSRGVHWVMKPDGKEVAENIEPAIAIEVME